jgi:hypothetical protein
MAARPPHPGGEEEGKEMAPKMIVILRHAEKDGPPDAPDTPADVHLSAVGKQRAENLETWIPQVCGGPPDYVFAAANSDDSHRPVETMTPLASTLPADRFITKYSKDDYNDLAHELLTDATFADKTVVVCWHHGKIPALAGALGVDEAQMRTAPEYHHGKWASQVFDRFWILTFPQGGGVQFRSEPEGV